MLRDDLIVIEANVTIRDIEPRIWRRLLLSADLNLAQLHEVLQASLGWTDSHLHQFIVGGLVFGAPEFDDGFADVDSPETFEATNVRLKDFSFYPNDPPTLLYEYDFGDGWVHEIDLKRIAGETGTQYPICMDGARNAPPEDVGGPFGYAEFLEAWNDPSHEEHKAMRRWAGRKFDPERFDPEVSTKAIRKALRRCRGGYRFRIEG